MITFTNFVVPILLPSLLFLCSSTGGEIENGDSPPLPASQLDVPPPQLAVPPPQLDAPIPLRIPLPPSALAMLLSTPDMDIPPQLRIPSTNSASTNSGSGGEGGLPPISPFPSPFLGPSPILAITRPSALDGVVSPTPSGRFSGVQISARPSALDDVVSPTPSGRFSGIHTPRITTSGRHSPRVGMSPIPIPGEGSSPIRKRSNAMMMITSTGAPALRILLTDDTQTILKVAGRLLRTNGHAGKG